MLKQVLAISALVLAGGVLVAGAAHAADELTTPQACFAAVDKLAQGWENHKYASKAESDKVGEALAKLEKLCEGNQLSEAQNTAAELKALIK